VNNTIRASFATSDVMKTGDKFKFYLADGFKDLTEMTPIPLCSMSPATYTCTIKEGYVEIAGFSGAIE